LFDFEAVISHETIKFDVVGVIPEKHIISNVSKICYISINLSAEFYEKYNKFIVWESVRNYNDNTPKKLLRYASGYDLHSEENIYWVYKNGGKVDKRTSRDNFVENVSLMFCKKQYQEYMPKIIQDLKDESNCEVVLEELKWTYFLEDFLDAIVTSENIRNIICFQIISENFIDKHFELIKPSHLQEIVNYQSLSSSYKNKLLGHERFKNIAIY